MSKKRIISVLLALTLMFSVLPMDIARAAVAEDFSIGDSEFGKNICKGTDDWCNNIYVSPGNKVTLKCKLEEKWYTDYHITDYVWYKEDINNMDKYVGGTFSDSNMKKVDCNKESYSYKPKKSEIIYCFVSTSENIGPVLRFIVNVDMGLTALQNVNLYKGNPGETANLSVDTSLINPKGKVSYEWYSETQLNQNKAPIMEKLSSTSNKVSVKVPELSSYVMCIIKYTEGKYTQTECKNFCVASFDEMERWPSFKGSDMVEVGETVSIYAKDAGAVDWYSGEISEENLIKSGVDTIKFDKAGKYTYVDKNKNENWDENSVYVCKNGGNIKLGKTVKGSVDKSIRESFYYTPSVSGEYSFEITNNPNVSLFVMNKNSVFSSYDILSSTENSSYASGDPSKNKNAKGRIHMTAGVTYKIVAMVEGNEVNTSQSFKLKLNKVKNNCKHNSGFTYNKAATLFAKGVTGEKHCGWCNAVLKKGKTISKKTITLSAKSLKKGAKLSWKKQKGVEGYQIKYADNKSFKKAKTVMIGKGKNSKKILKLKSWKNYYFAIRAYKTSGKKKIYSSWSKTVSVMTK